MEQMQEGFRSVNLRSVCRTCLQNLDDVQHDIFKTPHLRKKVTLCTSLAVDPGDGFPSNICQSCFLKLCDFYEFQQMCIYAMQRCQSLITSAKKQCVVQESNLDASIPIFSEAKQEQEGDAIDEEFLELLSIESPALKLAEENPERESPKVTSLEEESNCDTDYGNQQNEDSKCTEIDSDDKNETSNKKHKEEAPKKLNNVNVCEVCNKRFHKEQTYTAHKRTHEGLKAFPCPQCEKSFTKQCRLIEHVNSVHIEGRLVCSEEGCGRTYAVKQSLQKHMREVHNPTGCKLQRTSYVCDNCGKVLGSLRALKNHLFIHTDEERPFECTQCHKRYITKHKLKEHMNRHEGIKNYICPYCGLRKTTRTELNTHVNYHTKDKTYPCKFCSQVFNNTGNLKRHVRIVHEGIKDYKCKYCEKSFGKAETRKHHEMTHTGEKPHECTICHKRFIQPVSLHLHVKRHNKASKGSVQ